MSQKPPNPDELHYTTHVRPSVEKGAGYWLNEANKAMLYELAEEIDSRAVVVSSLWWNAQIHRRALELIETDDDLRPGYVTKLLTDINDNALFADAGYASPEEWFASEASFKAEGSGYQHNLRWWAGTLIPWCRQHKIFSDDESCDRWFFTARNQDGRSRYRRLREATSDMRRVIEDENDFLRESIEQEVKELNLSPGRASREVEKRLVRKQQEVITGFLKAVETPSISNAELRAELNNIRSPKPVIQLYKNGDGGWHVVEFDLTPRQLDRFYNNNQFSAIIEIVEAPHGKDNDITTTRNNS